MNSEVGEGIKVEIEVKGSHVSLKVQMLEMNSGFQMLNYE